MPGDSIELPAAAVLQHAHSVDGVADDVHQARGAVRDVSMDTQAYGQLCQFLPSLLSPLFTLASASLYDAEDSLRETSLKLRAVVRETTATDQAAGSAVTAAYGRLSQPPDLP